MVDGDYVCTGLSVGLRKLILVHVYTCTNMYTCIFKTNYKRMQTCF